MTARKEIDVLIFRGFGESTYSNFPSKMILTCVSILSLLQIVSTTVLSQFFRGKTVSVKIHKADGTIEVELTYPSSAHPRRTEG